MTGPDYMHEMLADCPHSPFCKNTWDPCLLALQHPHAQGDGATRTYHRCPLCHFVTSPLHRNWIHYGWDWPQPQHDPGPIPPEKGYTFEDFTAAMLVLALAIVIGGVILVVHL